MSESASPGSSATVEMPVQLLAEEFRWLEDFCRRTGQDVPELLTRIVRREVAIMSQIQDPLPSRSAQRECHACKGTGQLLLLPPQ